MTIEKIQTLFPHPARTRDTIVISKISDINGNSQLLTENYMFIYFLSLYFNKLLTDKYVIFTVSVGLLIRLFYCF